VRGVLPELPTAYCGTYTVDPHGNNRRRLYLLLAEPADLTNRGKSATLSIGKCRKGTVHFLSEPVIYTFLYSGSRVAVSRNRVAK
jgi:hypothetical protein